VIVILAAHQPQLSDDFRHDNDRYAREQPVKRAPRGKVLERKMGFTSVEEARQNDFRHGHNRQADVKPALEPGEAYRIFELPFQKAHGMILPASSRTKRG